MSAVAKPIEERFWPKVQKTETCWLWCGVVNPTGYATIGVQIRPGVRRNIGVHRLSYELAHGPIPAGLTVDHLCKVRRCVNPDHLEAVTMRENVLRGDTITGRNARKTSCPAGHLYDDTNTSTRDGKRHCLACHRDHQRAYVARRRAS